jgi:hypothetical protein
MNLLLCSFYTDTWEYPKHAARLRRECSVLGVDCQIEELSDAGGYLENCRQKPGYILETLERTGRPLLWLDVDTSLLRRPVGLRPWLDFMGRAKSGSDGRAWHVDAMFFGASLVACALLARWVEALADDISDELAFDRAWKAGGWPGAWETLPRTFSAGCTDPVVRHGRSTSPAKRAFQRSRRRVRA